MRELPHTQPRAITHMSDRNQGQGNYHIPQQNQNSNHNMNVMNTSNDNSIGESQTPYITEFSEKSANYIIPKDISKDAREAVSKATTEVIHKEINRALAKPTLNHVAPYNTEVRQKSNEEIVR